jgi:hypothetical protein
MPKKNSSFLLDLAGGTGTLSRDVGYKLPTYAAQHPRKKNASNTPRPKPKILHKWR